MEKILLVEDNAATAAKIKGFIKNINPIYEVSVFSSAGEAYSFACREQITLFILDIQLTDYKGTNLAKQLRALPKYKYTPILFETALAGEELNAYRDVQCYGFLIKPFDEDEFREVFYHAAGLSQQLHPVIKKLHIEQKQFVLEYDMADIVYLEAFGKKVVIHTFNSAFGQTKDTLSGYTLYGLLEKLDDPSFIQCHKSYIINKNYIEKIDKAGRLIALKNSADRIPVGAKYQSALW